MASVIEVTLVGGPTAVIEYAGLRWLTDPTFSEPGTYEGGLTKTTSPRLSPDEVDDVRRRSAAPQTAIVEVEADHFMRMI